MAGVTLGNQESFSRLSTLHVVAGGKFNPQPHREKAGKSAPVGRERVELDKFHQRIVAGHVLARELDAHVLCACVWVVRKCMCVGVV